MASAAALAAPAPTRRPCLGVATRRRSPHARGGTAPPAATAPSGLGGAPTVPYYVVDSFTSDAYAGNPAAVVLLPPAVSWPDEPWMRGVAAEFNLSETAFVLPPPQGSAAGAATGLRWLTPTDEVDLCGHATLAAAHALDAHEGTAKGRAFSTRSGTLLAAPRGSGAIELTFPAAGTEEAPAEAAARVGEALGVEVSWVGKAGTGDYVAILPGGPEELASLTPGSSRLAELVPDCRGVVATAEGGPGGALFSSRFWGPNVGIEEDPVTGSAHTALGPMWAGRLGVAEGQPMRAAQVGPRGGFLEVEVLPGGESVALRGEAVAVMRGELRAA